MDKITINASEYSSRVELEDYIKNEIGDDINANRLAGHTIQGTEEQLKSLGLSGTVRVFGIKCIIINN